MDGTDISKKATVALAGNPNAGKTTLFNLLTGLKQKVANYPGVTVESRSGAWVADGRTIELVDIPGLYSLDATSIDEQIARDAIIGENGMTRPDLVIAVVDATNLERNLYLVTQLCERGLPVVIALTMVDLFGKDGHKINAQQLSKLYGVPVVASDLQTSDGRSELAKAVNDQIGKQPQKLHLQQAETSDGVTSNPIFARYRFISDAVQSSVRHNDIERHRFSEKVDAVLTHKFFGLVILAAILLLVFQTIFSWANLPMDLLEKGFGALSDLARSALPEGILSDLIADGIIAGVGGVVVFLPQILLLFLFISILEDSGYMARAAFLLDRVMSKVGLHGKAFVPLISSFACAIPGIMATRTIEGRRDRFATILIAPFMSCSARLPVYTLMIATFFAGRQVFGFISLGAVLMLSMYVLGILVAIIVAFVLKRTLLNAPPPPFLMELPPYRMPKVRTVLQNMLTRAWLFLKRAGTVILAISIILWALMYFPRGLSPDHTDAAPAAVEESTSQAESDAEKINESEQLKHSYAGKLGHAIEPAIRPLGFDWKIGVALIASFAAREVLVSTLSIIYSVGKDENEESESLQSAVREAKRDDGSPVWTPLTALTLMVFFSLAMQCVSTLAVVRRETNSWSWPIFMFVYMTVLAYIAAFLTYQGGRALGFE